MGPINNLPQTINNLPQMKTMKTKDFLITGLGLISGASKITHKMQDVSSKITETAKNNLGIAHHVLKNTGFVLSVICLPFGVYDLVKTLKDAPKTKIRNAYDLTDLTLKLLGATGAFAGAISAIAETTLKMVASKIGEATIPHFGKFMEGVHIFAKFSTWVSYVMIGFTSVKICRQALFIFKHREVKQLDGDARFDFWLKHTVSLKRDAGLNDKQVKKIERFAKQIKLMKSNENSSKEVKELTNNVAVEMSNLIKNHIWKKMGENGINLTSNLLNGLAKPVFAATCVTAGTAAAVGCMMVAGSAALMITSAVVKEVNERSFQKNFTRLFDQVSPAAA